MSRSLITILILAIILFVFIIGAASYLSSLEDRSSSGSDTNAAKRGRAKYLIDSRWPFIHFNQENSASQQQ